MSRLKHYDDDGSTRFVTFCCYRNGKYLLKPIAKELLIKQINVARKKHNFKLLGYVIMPEHIHLVLLPIDSMKLGLVIREIKSKMAREYFSKTMSDVKGTRVFWQRRCYDHNCRSTDSVREKLIYCHNNPVIRGLVGEPGEYEWSSYNWYQGNREVPLFMDEYEF